MSAALTAAVFLHVTIDQTQYLSGVTFQDDSRNTWDTVK